MSTISSSANISGRGKRFIPHAVGRDAQFGGQPRARDLLKNVGMQSKEASFLSRLSGGQQQRVAIARALAKNPKGVASR